MYTVTDKQAETIVKNYNERVKDGKKINKDGFFQMLLEAHEFDHYMDQDGYYDFEISAHESILGRTENFTVHAEEMTEQPLEFVDGQIGSTFKHQGEPHLSPKTIDVEVTFNAREGVKVEIDDFGEWGLWDVNQKSFGYELGKGDFLKYLSNNSIEADDIVKLLMTQDEIEYDIDDIAEAISRIFEAYLEFVREYTELKAMERNKFKHCKTLEQLYRYANSCFELKQKYSNSLGVNDYTNNLYFTDLYTWDDIEYADSFPTFGGSDIDIDGAWIYSWNAKSYLECEADGWVIIDRDEEEE